jgi:hypothetical protein
VAREVFADAAHFVECGNIPATAQALKQLLFETKYREDLLSRASVVLARYSWREAARETLTAIEQAATLDP